MTFPEYVPDTTVSAVTYELTSIQEIERQFAYAGLQLHVDDLDSTDPNFDPRNSSGVNKANYIIELVQRASSHVMTLLAPRYMINHVYRIPRIREIATYWACHKLTRRRGNEPVFEEEYIEAMDELEMMRTGERYLDAPSNGQRAYMQSGVVDLRFARTQWRLIPEASTTINAGQKTVPYLGFGWL